MTPFWYKIEWLHECINQDCREHFRKEDTLSSFCPTCAWFFSLTARQQDDMLEFWEAQCRENI